MGKCDICGKDGLKSVAAHKRRQHAESAQSGNVTVISGLKGELGRIEALHEDNPQLADVLYNNYISGKSTQRLKRFYTKKGGNAVGIQVPQRGEI